MQEKGFYFNFKTNLTPFRSFSALLESFKVAPDRSRAFRRTILAVSKKREAEEKKFLQNKRKKESQEFEKLFTLKVSTTDEGTYLKTNFSFNNFNPKILGRNVVISYKEIDSLTPKKFNLAFSYEKAKNMGYTGEKADWKKLSLSNRKDFIKSKIKNDKDLESSLPTPSPIKNYRGRSLNKLSELRAYSYRKRILEEKRQARYFYNASLTLLM
jgi:hypothetical protein